MREGWEIKKLADLCKTFADGDWIEKKDQSPSGIRLVQTGNVGNGVFRGKDDSRHYISQETFERLHCTEIFPGDILVSRLPEPVGRGCLIPETGEKMITAVDCTIIRLNPGCLPQFLVYYSQSAEYQYSVREVSTGTTRQRISRKNLGEIGVPVPSLAEQQRIVDILDQEFAKIDALKANAEKSLQAAKDLFQATLNKELEPKDGWEIMRISEIASLKAGKFVSAKDIFEVPTGEMYPCYGGNGLRGYVKKFNHEGTYNLIGRQGALCGNINIATDKFYATEHAVVVSPIIPIVFKFLYYSLCNANINQYATGAAQPGISVQNVNEKLYLGIPSLAIQEQVATTLDLLKQKTDDICANAHKTLTLCDDLKQSLLRKAFNGEL